MVQSFSAGQTINPGAVESQVQPGQTFDSGQPVDDFARKTSRFEFQEAQHLGFGLLGKPSELLRQVPRQSSLCKLTLRLWTLQEH